MAVHTVTGDNFGEIVEAHPIVVLDFWATWCGPCRGFAPTFEASSERHPELFFGKVDTDEQEALAKAFNIRSVPTLMIIREKIIVVRESGALSQGGLEKVVEHACVLDMDDLRAEMAAFEGDIDAIDHAG